MEDQMSFKLICAVLILSLFFQTGCYNRVVLPEDPENFLNYDLEKYDNLKFASVDTDSLQNEKHDEAKTTLIILGVLLLIVLTVSSRGGSIGLGIGGS